jgi:hypothetical protein
MLQQPASGASLRRVRSAQLQWSRMGTPTPTRGVGCMVIAYSTLAHAPERRVEAKILKDLLGLRRRQGAPVRRQPVAVPGFGEIPALGEGQSCATGLLPGLAPTREMLIRPEEQHGLSSENDVFVPAGSGHRKMDDPFGFRKTVGTNGQGHRRIAATARSDDLCVAVEHRRDPQRIPNTACPPTLISTLNAKCCRDAPEGRGAKNFRVVIVQHDYMRFRQPAKSRAHESFRLPKRAGEFANRREMTLADGEAIDRQTEGRICFCHSGGLGHRRTHLLMADADSRRAGRNRSARA